MNALATQQAFAMCAMQLLRRLITPRFWMLVLLLPGACGAQGVQTTSGQSSTWLTLGIGASAIFSGSGLSTNLAVSHEFDGTLIALRRLSVTEFNLTFADPPHTPRPEESQVDYALMYGRTLRLAGAEAGLAAGFGYVTGTQRGKQISGIDYESSRISTLGLALQAHYLVTISSWFGIGLLGAADINPRRSFGSITLNVHLGDLD